MAMREELARDGFWLFRWRSLLPLIVMVLILSLMLFDPQAEPAWTDGMAWQLLCVAVSALGLMVRVATVGRVPHDTSRRSTREQMAAELNRTGMYSLVRHPLYLGNYLMWLGVVMAPGIWWLVVIVTLGYALYYERIMYSEEEYLRGRFGEEYLDWAGRTPAIIPDPRLWRPATLAFSWRTVLRREYASAFAMLLAFTLMGITDDYEAKVSFTLDHVHLYALAAGCALYLALRFTKRHTRALHVDGR